MTTLVIIESPYWSPDPAIVKRNLAYAENAMLDSLRRNEAPWLSHITYTKVLDDAILEERTLGIEAGLAWGRMAERTVVYQDLGITDGMRTGIDRALEQGRPVEYRVLGERWMGRVA